MKRYVILFSVISVCLMSSHLMASDFLPKSFSVSYEETYKSIGQGKEKKSFGKIDYEYPKKIFFDVQRPQKSTFVSNGVKSWYYTPPFIEGEQGQVTLQKSEGLPLAKFLDALKNGLKSNSVYTPLFEGKALTLSFSPVAQKDLQIREAKLFSNSPANEAQDLFSFSSLQLEYNNGQKVEIKFTDIKKNFLFPAGHFDFKIPPQTQIVK